MHWLIRAKETIKLAYYRFVVFHSKLRIRGAFENYLSRHFNSTMRSWNPINVYMFGNRSTGWFAHRLNSTCNACAKWIGAYTLAVTQGKINAFKSIENRWRHWRSWVEALVIACNISFLEIIGRSLLIQLIHCDWKIVYYKNNGVRL